MLQSIEANPGLTIALVSGLLVLIIIAIVPETLVNIVDQLFQLFGRLFGTLAGEVAAGASALFNIVRGVFNLESAEGQPAATSKPAPAAQADDTAPANGKPAGDQASVSTQAQPPSRETRFLWVAETIFIRLLYLATVIVIVGSDFVFAILRLQAVLFPTLPAPIHDLTFLSLLTGAFFVAIVLLTGALTLDFMNVLPKPARLFPDISDSLRRILLTICIISFILSLLVVGALFFEGQLLISAATNIPLVAILLATLIGVLEVLVAFLGTWGAIRGLAIILALVGGVVGIVLHLVGIAFRWVADAFDIIGSSILPDIIYGIAAIFGHRRERPLRPSTTSNVLSVIGFGERSTLFTTVLCDAIVRMYARSGLLATGVYANEPSVREDARSRLGALGINNISPITEKDPNPLETLKNRVIRAYQGKGASNKLVLWIVDAERTDQCADTLTALKREKRDLNVIVLCLVRSGGLQTADLFDRLKQLATQTLNDHGDTAICATIVVDDRSPLYRYHGEPVANQVVARSLSGMLLAPLHNPANPSFTTVLRDLGDVGFVFSALSTDSAPIVTDASGGSARSMGSVSPEQASERTTEVAARLLTRSNATTVDAKPGVGQQGLYLNFVVPISARTGDFQKFRTIISNWLAAKYPSYLYSIVDGEGVDLSESSHSSKGDRYAQVGVLYGVTEDDLAQKAVTAPSQTAGTTGSDS